MLVLCGALLSACVGVPVQQQYDARQAVRAAQNAGAAQYAPALLEEAQAHLTAGNTQMHDGEFRAARDEFNLARAKAIDARQAAEAAVGVVKH